MSILEYEPAHGSVIEATISNVELREPISDGDLKELAAALYEHGGLFDRDQDITSPSTRSLSRSDSGRSAIGRVGGTMPSDQPSEIIAARWQASVTQGRRGGQAGIATTSWCIAGSQRPS